MATESKQSSMRCHSADVVAATIRQRRSIRKYKSDPLPEAWIEAILRCGLQAPSPSNSQPVRYVRIDSPSLRNKLHQSFVEGHSRFIEKHKASGGHAKVRNWINAYKRYAEFMYDAPVLMAIGVTTETTGFAKRLVEAGLLDRDMRQSSDLGMTVGLALSGMMLKAQALGVGSCILTAPLVFIDAAEKVLSLEAMEIKCFLTLGFSDETPSETPRKPLSDVVQVI